MSLKKQYMKSKPVCKVTFRLSKEQAGETAKVALAGDFNNWETGSVPMKALKNGDFTVTLSLATGSEYQYRFVLDDRRWVTDPDADKLVDCRQYNCVNAVVVV